MSEIRVRAVEGLPEVRAGDTVGAMIADAASLDPGDVVVISQKVVSKAEGRVQTLADVQAGERARELAAELDKDPRLVELILGDSAEVIRAERGVLITRTHTGLVCANAGIDSSNTGTADASAPETVVLLPADPDASARRLRAEIQTRAGCEPLAVVIADSFGRAWRLGQADVAIGCAGLLPIDDWRGRGDRDGRELEATEIAVADEIAAAASLTRNKATGAPAAVVSGCRHLVTNDDGPGVAALIRPRADDLFG